MGVGDIERIERETKERREYVVPDDDGTIPAWASEQAEAAVDELIAMVKLVQEMSDRHFEVGAQAFKERDEARALADQLARKLDWIAECHPAIAGSIRRVLDFTYVQRSWKPSSTDVT